MPLLKLFSIFTLKDTIKRSRGARCGVVSRTLEAVHKRNFLGPVVKPSPERPRPSPAVTTNQKTFASPFFASFPISRDRRKLQVSASEAFPKTLAH